MYVCYRDHTTFGYFSTLTSLVKSHKGLTLTKKELEPFLNFTVVECTISSQGNIRDMFSRVLMAEASLLYAIPASNYSYLVSTSHHITLAPPETVNRYDKGFSI